MVNRWKIYSLYRQINEQPLYILFNVEIFQKDHLCPDVPLFLGTGPYYIRLAKVAIRQGCRSDGRWVFSQIQGSLGMILWLVSWRSSSDRSTISLLPEWHWCRKGVHSGDGKLAYADEKCVKKKLILPFSWLKPVRVPSPRSVIGLAGCGSKAPGSPGSLPDERAAPKDEPYAAVGIHEMIFRPVCVTLGTADQTAWWLMW